MIPVPIMVPIYVVHAEGRARPRSAQDKLADAVRTHDRLRTDASRRRDPDAALRLFEGLLAGRWTLVDRFERDGRRYVVAYENTDETAALSPREREVLVLGARGLSVKRIAAELAISQGAAGAYFASARRKTGISSRAELARWFRGARSG
jgi:DNA-binding CsgD family transcriptional regulator